MLTFIMYVVSIVATLVLFKFTNKMFYTIARSDLIGGGGSLFLVLLPVVNIVSGVVSFIIVGFMFVINHNYQSNNKLWKFYCDFISGKKGN